MITITTPPLNYPNLQWRQALAEAAIISLFVLALFYYWFAHVNRSEIFLYGHIAGGIMTEPAQPFDEATSSRYWMAGLVAGGAVLLLYAVFNGVRGRIAGRRDRPMSMPTWWQVWLLCLIPLGIGIPAITMTVNFPTLPLPLALASTIATLFSLAIALLLGSLAISYPRDLLWLLADGVGIIPPLLLFRVIELPGRGLSVQPAIVAGALLIGLICGAVWLVGMSWLRKRHHKVIPNAILLLTAGVALSYLLLPLLHHLSSSEYHYISTAGNFFAFNPVIQFVAFGVAILFAVSITQWRYRQGKMG